MEQPAPPLFDGTIEWEEPLKTKIQNHRFIEKALKLLKPPSFSRFERVLELL
jgi:hypothetical protein